ncbi:MAG: carboxyltransferase domain-containing protein, partial [Clostridia bacterium]|nr:carboxyltransferase domain-containing protein [Clostridia bacterium]
MSFTDTYGIQVFSDRVMRERLSAQAYDSYKQLSQEGGALTRDVLVIPVLYGGDAGPDIGKVAKTNGLTENEVVALHSGT